jgi:hypothetical protein
MLLGPEGTGRGSVLLWWPCRPNRRAGAWWGWVVSVRSLRTVQWTRASLIFCGQVFKSIRWMPWHQEPKKDVVACDKPRGAGKRAVIRGCPNGETRPESCLVTRA